MRTPWQNFLAALPLATAAALAACGGSSPPAENPTSTVDGGAAPAASASAAAAVTDAGANATPNPSPADQPKTATTEAPKFDDLPKEKKVDIMVSKVVPNVGKLFKEHDAKRYGKFGCTTCHGPDKKQDPHDVLPKLTLSGGGFDKLAKNKPEVLKWMTGVEHEMASALNEPVYDPATKKGFGCAGCHTVN